MATIKQFEDIEAWQLGRHMCIEIRKITEQGEFQNDYFLKGQIRRSSDSMMDNIAEGYSRDGSKEFVQFLSFAKGSATEVQSQLYRALDYNYINTETFNVLYNQTNSIIGKPTNLIKYLTSSNIKGNKYPKQPFPILGFRSKYNSGIGISLCSNCTTLETLNHEP